MVQLSFIDYTICRIGVKYFEILVNYFFGQFFSQSVFNSTNILLDANINHKFSRNTFPGVRYLYLCTRRLFSLVQAILCPTCLFCKHLASKQACIP